MKESRVLLMWSPHVPSYFNAGHHLLPFTVAAYLRKVNVADKVVVVDAGALNYSWKDIGDFLIEQPDILGIANDFDAVDGLERLIHYTRSISPFTKIITFGRLSATLPDLFRNLEFDAVVAAGDAEVGVAGYIHAVLHNDDRPQPGTWVRTRSGWRAPSGPGRTLSASDWALPDVREIPYDAYDRMYADDTNRFCGIPGRRELVVPIARGCPIGCSFCDVPAREGLAERRLPVARAVEYIDSATRRAAFDYVSMYAPTFTLDRAWVREFCRTFQGSRAALPWKCTTSTHHLDQELVKLMGWAGCIRISLGVETLENSAAKTLPRAKHATEARLNDIASWCAAGNIELNCFVILGLPGASADGTQATVEYLERLGARVRPTMYTDWSRMAPDMTLTEVALFNRQVLPPGTEPSAADAFYRLYFRRHASLTRVADRIALADRTTLRAPARGLA
jgi:anaerobic magnesium-protoporphyrin IX monomethyl ester cyclase